MVVMDDDADYGEEEEEDDMQIPQKNIYQNQ